MPVPTGIDALPPSLRASVGSIGYHPGMKRSNEITLDYDSGVQVVKKAKTTFTVDLESYYYGTIEGDISVGIIFVYLFFIYVCSGSTTRWKNLHFLHTLPTTTTLKYDWRCQNQFQNVFSLKVLMSEFKADMAFKCHLCKKVG